MRRGCLRLRMFRRRCLCWGLCVPVTAWWPLRMTLPKHLRTALMAAMLRWRARRPPMRLPPRPRSLMLRLMPRGRTCGGSSTPSAGLDCACPICVRWVERLARPMRCWLWTTPWRRLLAAIRCAWVPCCRSKRSTVCAPVTLHASWLPYRSRARSSSAIVWMPRLSACTSCLRAVAWASLVCLLTRLVCWSAGWTRSIPACRHTSTAPVRWPSIWPPTRWCATCAIPG